MNSFEILQAMTDIPNEPILSARDCLGYHREEGPMPKHSPKRIWLIAAVVALLLLLMGCTVAYVLSLDNMVLGTEYFEDRNGETEPRTQLSLQGFVGSNSYQAAKEWYEFEQSYDPNREIMDTLTHEEMKMPEEYLSYHCYTPEMTAKVDEICRKYGLEKQGEALIPVYEDDFYDVLQIRSILKDDAEAEVEISPVYFYRTGSFMLSCETKLTGNNNLWIYPIEYQYYCVMKTDFDTVGLNIGEEKSYDQWTYTTRDGTELLLAISEDKALLIADLEKFFVTMNILNPRVGDIIVGEQLMTRNVMEAFAETFDFSFMPQRPTEEQIAQIRAKELAFAEERKAKLEAIEEENQKLFGQESYEARVKFHLENGYEDSLRMGYAFYDIDKNGVEELLIGTDGYINYIYTDTGSEAAAIIGWPDYATAYFTEDGTIVNTDDYHTWFYQLDHTEKVNSYYVTYRPNWYPESESPWRLCYSFYTDERPITQEQYNQYRSGEGRVVLDFLPLAEYPLPETPNIHADGKDVTWIHAGDTYEELIRECVLNPREKMPDVYYDSFYTLRDLDEDGQEELILDNGYTRAVYTVENGKAVAMYSVSSISDAVLHICEGNIIEVIHSYPGQNKAYCYYRMSGTTGKMVEYLRYDADKNPQNPWFRSTDATGQDISLEPITKAEFDRIRITYAPLELDWKPVTEYPLS